MTEPMQQAFCPKCGQSNAVSPQMAGQTIQCAKCGQPFTVQPLPMPMGVNYAGPGVAPRSNGFAIASLVCGCIVCVPLAGIS